MAEIISPVTSRRRTALLVTSLAAVLLGFGLVSMPPDEPFAVFGKKFQMEPIVLFRLISAIIIYQLANFWWALVDDVGNYKKVAAQEFRTILMHLGEISDHLENIQTLPNQPRPGDVKAELDRIIDIGGGLDKWVKRTKERMSFHEASAKFRMYVWEAGLPTFLAIAGEIAMSFA